MIDREEMTEIMARRDEMLNSLAVSVKISHGQALTLIVADLVAKYKYVLEDDRKKDIQTSFKDVLRYYVDEEEFEQLMKEKKWEKDT